MPRIISHFSCGAASAVATKLSRPDEIWYAETGSEDPDNERFLLDCERWFGQPVTRIRGKYRDTWHVWEANRYISGVKGAKCTYELKILPRKRLERPCDIHIFGYTADSQDVRRAMTFGENYPDVKTEFPLIDRGITKAACLALLQKAGIAPPRTYALGLPNANCIPCCKAQSPAYWALIRKEFPEQFKRMVDLSRKLGVTLTRMNGERKFIDEIPNDWPVTEPIAPACDMLCHLSEEDLLGES